VSQGVPVMLFDQEISYCFLLTVCKTYKHIEGAYVLYMQPTVKSMHAITTCTLVQAVV